MTCYLLMKNGIIIAGKLADTRFMRRCRAALRTAAKSHEFVKTIFSHIRKV